MTEKKIDDSELAEISGAGELTKPEAEVDKTSEFGTGGPTSGGGGGGSPSGPESDGTGSGGLTTPQQD